MCGYTGCVHLLDHVSGMYICMHVYVYIYAYICTCMYIYTSPDIFSHIKTTYTHIYTRARAHTLTHMHTTDIYCKTLSEKLMTSLERAGKLGVNAFTAAIKKEALEFCEAPGGHELLAMVGYVYAQEGKQHAGRWLGIEGFFAQIQEKAHVASTGALVLMDAVKTANMAQEMGERRRGVRTEEQQREMEARMMRYYTHTHTHTHTVYINIYSLSLSLSLSHPLSLSL